MWPHRRQPPGSPIPGILQARTLEWVAISFSNAGKWKVKVKSLRKCPALCDPMDCSLPGSSIHGIFQARVLEWGAIAFSRSRKVTYTKRAELAVWWVNQQRREWSRWWRVSQHSGFPVITQTWKAVLRIKRWDDRGAIEAILNCRRFITSKLYDKHKAHIQIAHPHHNLTSFWLVTHSQPYPSLFSIPSEASSTQIPHFLPLTYPFIFLLSVPHQVSVHNPTLRVRSSERIFNLHLANSLDPLTLFSLSPPGGTPILDKRILILRCPSPSGCWSVEETHKTRCASGNDSDAVVNTTQTIWKPQSRKPRTAHQGVCITWVNRST